MPRRNRNADPNPDSRPRHGHRNGYDPGNTAGFSLPTGMEDTPVSSRADDTPATESTELASAVSE